MVANAITCALRQLNLDMTGRALGRIGTALVLELVVDQQLHRGRAPQRRDRIDPAGWDRLDLVERLVVGAAAEVLGQPPFLHGCGRGGCEPSFELAVEVNARIALASRIETARAACRKLPVDEARHELIGRGPVAVAAAEHGVAHLR